MSTGRLNKTQKNDMTQQTKHCKARPHEASPGNKHTEQQNKTAATKVKQNTTTYLYISKAASTKQNGTHTHIPK